LPQRVLGFDYGARAIGVAVGQAVTGTARPLAVLLGSPRPGGGSRQRRLEPDWPVIERLIREWRPDALVVGIPHTDAGEDYPVTAQAEAFRRDLSARFGLPAWPADERCTTAAARSEMRERGGRGTRRSDALAAALIVEGWLAAPQWVASAGAFVEGAASTSGTEHPVGVSA